MIAVNTILKDTIVIADDDPVVRHILTAILSADGLNVEVASNGAECLDLLRAHMGQSTRPSAVFLDMFLGDQSGLEVLRELRSMFDPDPPPVVMLSANPREEALAVDRSITPDDYLEKPFTGKIVLEVLAKYRT